MTKDFSFEILSSEKKSAMQIGSLVGLVREDFSFEATKTLRSLFDQPDFSDVTLVCEDQKQILAHKAILASGSPFFKNILSLNPHPTPLLYLRVNFSDLHAIVRFLYTGQCKVAEAELERFLGIAKCLEIFGIATDGGVKAKEVPNNQPNFNISAGELRRDENLGGELALEENSHDENFENNLREEIAENGIDETFENITTDENDVVAEKDMFSEIKEEPKGNTEPYCNECQLKFPTQPQLKEHMNTDHLFCCDTLFSSEKSLRSHKWRNRNKKDDERHSSDEKTTKVDSDVHFPETEEQMSFFGIGRRENMAYDKDFFAFR